MFLQATKTVSAPISRREDKLQFFPGDMYKSCNTCAFLVSTGFPEENGGIQYACVPLELHFFVLGPIKCDAQSLAVLITIKEWKADKSCLGSRTHLGVYAPCSGTLFLQGGIPIAIQGTREDFHFRARLPLQIQKGDCGYNVTHTHLTRVSPCDTVTRTLFDQSLQLVLPDPTNGLVHVVDWTCLLRLKYLAAAGTGLLPRSTAHYQSTVGDAVKEGTFLMCCGHLSCSTCPDECGCESTSNDLAACSTDPALGCS